MTFKIYYAASTCGFYRSDIHPSIPDDAVEITDEQHAALLVGQSSGKQIAADANGNPILRDFPPPTPTALWTAYRVTALAALSKSDITVLRCAESGVTVPAAWAAYRNALRAIAGAESGDHTQALPSVPAYPAGT